MLFSFGSNGNGQLGIGHEEDTHVPTRCISTSVFPETGPPKSLVAGGNHTLVLFPGGRLYSSGLNTYGQCGLPISMGTSFSKFQRVPPPPDGGCWDHVSAGWEFSILVSTTGAIFACGSGTKGELGLGDNVTSCELTRMEPFLTGAAMIALSSGMAHSIAVMDNGEVWGWGAGRKGQLGHPMEKTVGIPRCVQMGYAVAAAGCGREFTFVMSATGARHAMLGGKGRFRLEEDTPEQGEMRGWRQVGAAWGSVLVLKADGTVKGWGRNDKGQLPPKGLQGVQEMAVGSEHGLAVVGGKVVTWGWGEHGNCGLDRSQNGGDVIGGVHVVEVHGTAKRVWAGCATSWAWTE
ncbi:regulator of chromosome condensation 1/beta-lactamase-inhibitor protein II [Tricharina praecox]|uniref:regulator of chromosome condensation 1/beta-lactamase-inhibitor protein II n=1 Tax=Tricharina praecox TaxID=43433 RepID=UPI00221F877D|nr:regulator of chromosome condensation 1/beta-lactamase-inhibitor protein II [Tricharina praecox]KAI5856092.1 regulator of chromosome condensation 1/beta-lactamase-inhibitor protein II [Tricharina praecox]